MSAISQEVLLTCVLCCRAISQFFLELLAGSTLQNEVVTNESQAKIK